MPYLASCRRWNEQLAEDSPSNSAARVAVSGPSVRSRPISDILIGCASARSAFGSVIRLVERGPPDAIEVSGIVAKIALQSLFCNMFFAKESWDAAARWAWGEGVRRACGGGGRGGVEARVLQLAVYRH